MDFLAEYGMFLAKALTLVVALALVLAVTGAAMQRRRGPDDGHLEIKDMNQEYRDMEATLDTVLDRKQRKRKEKQRKKEKKQEKKARKAVDAVGNADSGDSGTNGTDSDDKARRKRIYVLSFHGDLQASAVASLRREVSALLTVAGPGDEVVVRLESGGGVVHGYGLGASQLARLREHRVPLTVAVDKVAASGGYLMACVADRIIAAPFAIIGSIGVLAQIPNMHRLLKKHDIDFEQFTAGEFKRTVTLFGSTSQKMRDKMQQDIEDVHQLFKDFVIRQRPALDIERVSTGEHWPALKAQELGLVDEVRTSDDYLMSRRDDADVYAVRWVLRQSLGQRLRLPFAALFGRGRAVPGEDEAGVRYPLL